MARPHRPKGAWSEKGWRDAIRLAVNEVGEGKHKKLRLLATKLVEAGLAGDISALREIGDRLDGKATQQIEATITETRMVAELPPTAKDTAEWSSQHGPH
jgi:hypothetical protein